MNQYSQDRQKFFVGVGFLHCFGCLVDFEILTVMLAFAEYERGMIVERTQTGKTVARQDPNFRDGRPKKFTPEQIALSLDLLEQGKT